MAEIQVLQPMTIRFDGRYCHASLIDECDYYSRHGTSYLEYEQTHSFHRYPRGGWTGNLKIECADGGRPIRHEECIDEFGE